MRQVLIYAGTTEGRELAETLAENGVPATVCVATEYGEAVLPELDGITVHTGRLAQEQMRELAQNGEFCAVVDATHPFAVVASRNIRESAQEADLPYLRLQRDTGGWDAQNLQRFSDTQSCAEALAQTEGKILLTTGSKELSVFCRQERVRDRLIVRVLPGEESLRLCRENGLAGKQVIAMQGPFLMELNQALLRQYGIRYLVTKESGKAGGLMEKLEAARSCGVTTYLIGNPEREKGLSFEMAVAELGRLLGKTIEFECEMRIALIGAGMGTRDSMTVEAAEILSQTDYLLGAERLIAAYSPRLEKRPYYLAKDIIPYLNKIRNKQKLCTISILFSGDTGYFSGCYKLYQELIKNEFKNVSIYPGISSISYLSAKTGIPYQEAELVSVHGKGSVSAWGATLLEKIRQNRAVFLLVSGVEDIRQIGKLLDTQETQDALQEEDQIERKLFSECKIWVGYEMGRQAERYVCLTPQKAQELEQEGLYCCAIINPAPENRALTHMIADKEFIRERVPMTKAEVRALSVEKLGICENAVIYDIGSGTGSVAVELARCSPTVRVYAVEQKPEAVSLIQKNIKKFGLSNVEVVEGTAPDVLEELPMPTHAFIGGSSGNLREILAVLNKKNPDIRIAASAVSLETIGEFAALAEEYEESELLQLQVSRAKPLGRYHLLQAENPVMLAVFRNRRNG